jgi:branched-chain amino acid transport system permease protein
MSSPSWRPWLYLVLGLVGVYALSFVVAGLGGYDERIVVNIGINMILAISLNLINGHTGQFSLGHAGFMSVGAYTTAAFVTLWAPGIFGTLDDTLMQGIVLLIGILLGGLTAALAGLLVGIPSLRLKGDYLAIVTLGFGEIIRVVLNNVPQLGGSLGMGNLPRYTTFLWVFIIVVLLVFIVQRLMSSTYGKGFLAVRDDEVAAEAMGVDTTRYKVTAFVIGAFFAGVAGGLYAHYNQLIRPEDFGFIKSIEIVVMVILGGMGSTYGVLFAAAILTFLPEWMRDVEFIGIKFRDFRMSIYALILILLMLTRPQGLFGDFHLLAMIRRRLATRKQEAKPNVSG